MKKNENFRKFPEICQDFSVLLFNFWNYQKTFQTLKYKFNAEFFIDFFFQNFLKFLGDFQDFLVSFGITYSSKFPENPEE